MTDIHSFSVGSGPLSYVVFESWISEPPLSALEKFNVTPPYHLEICNIVFEMNVLTIYFCLKIYFLIDSLWLVRQKFLISAKKLEFRQGKGVNKFFKSCHECCRKWNCENHSILWGCPLLTSNWSVLLSSVQGKLIYLMFHRAQRSTFVSIQFLSFQGNWTLSINSSFGFY